MGAIMRKVSFQGIQLTASERRKLDIQRRPLLNQRLAVEVSEAVRVDSERKAAGVKPACWWSLERYERGTPYVGDIITR